VLEHDFVGLDRASALQRFLADKAARAGRSMRLRIQLRSFDGVCRLVERNVGVGIVPETTARWAAKTMAIKAVQLTDPWALRDLSICVRDYKALPPYARQLVDHMREETAGDYVSSTLRHQHPVIEIEDHRPDRPLAALSGKVRARLVLVGDRAQAQAAARRQGVPASRPWPALLVPTRTPSARRTAARRVAAAIDRRDVKRIRKPVERDRSARANITPYAP
jgi:hypothetical protein